VETGKDATTGQPVKPAPAPVNPEAGPRAVPKAAAGEGPITFAVLRGPTARPTPVHAPVPAGSIQPSAQRPVGVVVTDTDGPAEGAQWRIDGGAWQPLAAGIRAEGRVEVRTGLDAQATLAVGNMVNLHIGRLSRVVIERAAPSGGVGFTSEHALLPSVTVERGCVDLRAVLGESPVETVVHSPDRAGFTLLPGTRVTYSAFRGTRVEAAPMMRVAGR
jgi:hypothetical protein